MNKGASVVAEVLPGTARIVDTVQGVVNGAKHDVNHAVDAVNDLGQGVVNTAATGLYGVVSGVANTLQGGRGGRSYRISSSHSSHSSH